MIHVFIWGAICCFVSTFVWTFIVGKHMYEKGYENGYSAHRYLTELHKQEEMMAVFANNTNEK